MALKALKLGFLPLVVIILAAALTTTSQSGHTTMRNAAMQDPNWAELMKSMETMHAAMASAKPSGSNDADFVNLMLPHHQAAIDMARAELLHGSDAQMRRLAQEIITDQQSEIQLMQLWLGRRGTQSKEQRIPDSQPDSQKEP